MKKILFLGIVLLFLFACVSEPEMNQNEAEQKEMPDIENNGQENNSVIGKPANEIEPAEENDGAIQPEKEADENESEKNDADSEEELPDTEVGYQGALPDLEVKTLILDGPAKAGDERVNFILVVNNSSTVPFSLNDKSIVVKLFDMDTDEEIASYRDGPYEETINWLAKTKYAYKIRSFKNPKILETAGAKNIRAKADYENSLNEANEENNIKEFQITVR
ncbi:MAG: hypothetical protein ABIA76_03470 [Candidatus Diapherotrites archaeon]